MGKISKKTDEKKAVDAIVPKKANPTKEAKVTVEESVDNCASSIHATQLAMSELAKSFKKYAEANSRQLTRMKSDISSEKARGEELSNDVDTIFTVAHDHMDRIERLERNQWRLVIGLVLASVITIIFIATGVH